VLGVLRQRWWVIALCMVVSLLVALLYLARKPNEYTATASLQFANNSLTNQVAGVGGGQSVDPEGENNTNVQLVTTTPVAEKVVNSLRLHISPGELLEKVSASDPQNDSIIDVSVTDSSPTVAAALANAFTQQYVAYSQEQNEEQLVRGQQLIAQKAAQLPPSDTTDRANLDALSQKLLLLQAVATANAKVADVASPPEAPSSPKRKATAIVALVFGLLVGVGVALLVNLLTRRVRGLEDFEDLYGMRAIAVVPTAPARRRGGLVGAADLEPFRILQNGLSLLRPDGNVKLVLVTSAIPTEGKTTVALGLARAAATSGSEVILVEADVRRPSLAQRLNLDAGAGGLTEALVEHVDPLELLSTPFPELDRLRVLTAGATGRASQVGLRSSGLGELFNSLALHADLVVIDSAPLLPVVDTRVLLDELNVDAQLIIARAGVTTRDAIRGTRALLEQRRLHDSVGLVVNDIAVALPDYYGTDDSASVSPSGRKYSAPVG